MRPLSYLTDESLSELLSTAMRIARRGGERYPAVWRILHEYYARVTERA